MQFSIGKYTSRELLKILDVEHLNGLSPKKRRKIIDKILSDDDVMTFLFIPTKVDKNVSTDYVKELYRRMTSPVAINAIARILARLDPGELDRTRSTFLTSLCNIAIEQNNESLREADRMKEKKAISSAELHEITDIIEDMNEDIVYILKFLKKNVKSEAKRLSEVTDIPVCVCQLGLSTIPEQKYVDRYKVGFYLNRFLGQVYSDVNEYGSFNVIDVDWAKFFTNIFGKENVLEVATFILLEGVNRIDKYKDSKSVKTCWNSLTDFALKYLNDAPDANRRQMIELYIKRIDKMFQNNVFDLRVDLTKLSEINYPRLVDTIIKYADKITEIINKGTEMLS